MRTIAVLMATLGLALGVLASGAAREAVDAAPLAQATATATLPPRILYGDGWGLQAFPESEQNCIEDVAGYRGGGFSCVAGTPVAR